MHACMCAWELVEESTYHRTCAPMHARNFRPLGGVHLDPKAYHEKMSQPGTVIVDVRNHYEADIGRFDKQEFVGGAKYIDPKVGFHLHICT